MPSRLASPVITVDINHIAKVDPSNVDNLFSMWTIFSKCAESLENGRRLENLSWRLWNRETFCCDDKERIVDKALPAIPRRPKRQDSDTYSDMPALSSSVESAPSDDEFKHRPNAVGIKPVRPPLIRGDSSETHRGNEKHMTPVHLVKIMEELDKTKSAAEHWISRRNSESLHNRETSKPIVPKTSSSHPSRSSERASEESKTELKTSHSVVRGFSPGRVSSSYRSGTITQEPLPAATKVQPAKPTKKKPVFFLGSSSSYSDDEDDESYSSRKSGNGVKRPSADKKTSFRDEVATRTVYDEDATTDDDDDDDDGISESAIEEEDSDWDDLSESQSSSPDENGMFKRVDSRSHLPSRRSLLSTMLHEPERAAHLANAASKSTPVLRKRPSPPLAPSPLETQEPQAPAAIPRSKPIMTSAQPLTLSPRTTRRNMLATELTPSLRKHMWVERAQKNATATAHLKRRHTAHDMTKLVDYPQPTLRKQPQTSRNNSWNPYFDDGQYEYHAAGW